MEEKLNKEAKKGGLRLAGGAPRITRRMHRQRGWQHTSGREEGSSVASSGDLGAVVDRGRRSGGIYSWNERSSLGECERLDCWFSAFTCCVLTRGR